MILSCPSCGTRYLVDASQIGELGRQVKCARCAHEWHQTPPEESPTVEAFDAAQEERRKNAPEAAASPEPAPAESPSPPDGPDPDDPMADVRPPLRESPNEDRGRAFRDLLDEEEREERPQRTNLPALPRKRLRWGLILGWLFLILFVLTVLVGGFVARDAVVSAWPPATKLYRLLGLPLAGDPPAPAEDAQSDAAAAPETPAEPKPAPDINSILKTAITRQEFVRGQDGQTLLIVEGQVSNISKSAQTVPSLRLDIEDASGRSLFHWTVKTDRGTLSAGERTTFSTRLPDPPAGASKLFASFVIGEK